MNAPKLDLFVVYPYPKILASVSRMSSGDIVARKDGSTRPDVQIWSDLMGDQFLKELKVSLPAVYKHFTENRLWRKYKHYYRYDIVGIRRIM